MKNTGLTVGIIITIIVIIVVIIYLKKKKKTTTSEEVKEKEITIDPRAIRTAVMPQV